MFWNRSKRLLREVREKQARLDVVRHLLEKGADIYMRGEMGMHAIDWALMHGNLGILCLMLPHIKDINEKINDSTLLIQFVLHKADVDTIQSVLDRGADPNIESGGYSTALSNAVGDGHRATVELLLKRGANPNFGTNPPIFDAAQNADMIELLIAHGADVSLKRHYDGRTPLTYAVFF